MSQRRPLNDIHRNGEPPPDLFDYFATAFNPGWPDRFGQTLWEWVASSGLAPIRTLSLFSGAGGLDIGFHQAGFDVRTAVEHDAVCTNTLRFNAGPNRLFPNLDVREED